jgi:hypothetical protein
MYSIRWLIQYAHYFERTGNEELTDLFRRMEIEEHQRDIDSDEHILVEKLPIEKLVDGVFQLDNTQIPTGAEKELAERVHYWTERGHPVVKGTEVPLLVDSDNDYDYNVEYGCDLDDGDESYYMRSVTVHHSQQTATMFDNDSTTMSRLQSTQQSQAEAASDLKNSKETKDKIIVDLAREGLKSAEDNKEVFELYHTKLKELTTMINEKAVSLKEPNSANRSGLHLPESGTCTKKAKRKRGPHG